MEKRGYYSGSSIAGKLTQRYREQGFFARGNIFYRLDGEGIHFRRFFSGKQLTIPIEAIEEIIFSPSNSGKRLFRHVFTTVIWRHDDLSLHSGFRFSPEDESFLIALGGTENKRT